MYFFCVSLRILLDMLAALLVVRPPDDAFDLYSPFKNRFKYGSLP